MHDEIDYDVRYSYGEMNSFIKMLEEYVETFDIKEQVGPDYSNEDIMNTFTIDDGVINFDINFNLDDYITTMAGGEAEFIDQMTADKQYFFSIGSSISDVNEICNDTDDTPPSYIEVGTLLQNKDDGQSYLWTGQDWIHVKFINNTIVPVEEAREDPELYNALAVAIKPPKF